MEARPPSKSRPSCARSAASSALSMSRAARGRGAGRPVMRPADFRTSRLTEEPDHTSDDADEADAAGDDRLVSRVFCDQLDVAVAPLEPLDCGVAVDQGDHD